MTYFDVPTLEDFYRRVSADGGVPVDAFQRELRDLFGSERSTSDLNNFRLSKAPWKKLADEIVPISKFLDLKKIDKGRIRIHPSISRLIGTVINFGSTCAWEPVSGVHDRHRCGPSLTRGFCINFQR